MSDEQNKEILSINQIRQVLEDVRNNPLSHDHPADLVAKCESFKSQIEKTLGEQFKLNPIFQFAENMRLVQESITKLYGEFYSNFKEFSRINWYLSPRIFDETSLVELVKHITKKDFSELEVLIISEAEKLIGEILSDCCNSFQSRKSIFEEIGKAYESEMYNSVIVLAYTQADGICQDTFGNGFFDKELLSPELKKKKKKVQSDYQLTTYRKMRERQFNHSISVVEQLGILTNEITAYSQDGKYLNPEIRKTSFNRHLVLHGHSKEFGTRINAIRSICILDFLHYFITETLPHDNSFE